MHFKSLRWVAEIVYEDVSSVCEGELGGVHTTRMIGARKDAVPITQGCQIALGIEMNLGSSGRDVPYNIVGRTNIIYTNVAIDTSHRQEVCLCVD